MASNGDKVFFEDFKADDELVRTVFMRRLKVEWASWNELNLQGWDDYVTFAPQSSPAHLLLRATRVYWQLVNEGIIYPGRMKVVPNASYIDQNSFLPPYFNLTRYGAEVLNQPSFEPHYPKSYMTELLQIGDKDATVVAYMSEAVDAFRRGSLTASMLLLGVAAERVFLLVCDAVGGALQSTTESAKFGQVMSKNQIKPKLDWLSHKLDAVKKVVPDGSALLVLSIYNLMRLQRNDLGHPTETPPHVTRTQARAYLQMLPACYQKAHELIVALTDSKI